jgi:hypothetical protein
VAILIAGPKLLSKDSGRITGFCKTITQNRIGQGIGEPYFYIIPISPLRTIHLIIGKLFVSFPALRG